MEALKETKAPTSIGYNDMAIMIAFGQSDEYGIPTVGASMIADYLARNPSVPEDAGMQSGAVQEYLDVLINNALLWRQENPHTYKMRDDIGSCIIDNFERNKSPHIQEMLFNRFRIYCANEMAEKGKLKPPQ